MDINLKQQQQDLEARLQRRAFRILRLENVLILRRLVKTERARLDDSADYIGSSYESALYGLYTDLRNQEKNLVQQVDDINDARRAEKERLNSGSI